MGVVYEVLDRTQGQKLAVKTLVRFSPAALYQFKREFRLLADVRHPNLLRLYELFAADSEQVFFSMELVNGRDFLAYTRRADPAIASGLIAERPTRDEARLGRRDAGRASSNGEKDPTRAHEHRLGAKTKTCEADVDRLRPALCQLTEGVHALHAAAKLHRDIKPSNVLVTNEGRVVLLDFGLATELGPVVGDHLQESVMAGTPVYMAPELTRDAPASPASDWYSVGVMLYEALVGNPPFDGSTLAVMDAKVSLDAVPPGACVEGVPEDLDRLCCALLQRDPHLRPDGRQILRSVGARRSARPSVGHAKPGNPSLVGRASHLVALEAAFQEASRGRAMAIRIFGASGMGKSALVQCFVDDLANKGHALVLRSRVYERESVPYKAADGVVDALSRYLVRHEVNGDSLRLPQHISSLACLFPVLRRVEAIAHLPDETRTDPHGTRRRAFGALRDLLADMAAQKPVVLYLDDVQWGDVDSASLWLDVMRPPLKSRILLLMTYRGGDVAASPFLRELLDHWPEGAELRELEVGPLAAEDAERLVLEPLGATTELARRIAAGIARESAGSAFLAQELACSVKSEHLASSGGPHRSGEILTLEQMIRERLAQSPPQAQRVLELVTVSGRPVPVGVLAEATGLDERVYEVLTLLGEQRFVRVRFHGGQEVVETSHDRIRETIFALLPAATKTAHHACLARALEPRVSSSADPEALVVHLLGAGEVKRAGGFALRAAEQAAQKLAFERSETLYRLAHETLPSGTPEARSAHRRLGDVLEWAGRSAEAGLVYLEAAEGAPPLERAELESSSAMQLLFAGRVDEGGRVLVRSLTALGMWSPRSALSALFGLVFYRIWVRVEVTRLSRRSAKKIEALDWARIEALYAAAFGLTFIDVIAGACMQARHAALALRRGDCFQQVRALALEASHLSTAGGPVGERESALDQLARRLAEQCGTTDGSAFVQACHGVRMFLHGLFKQSQEILDVVYENLPQQRAGWQSNTWIYNMYSLVNLGQFATLAERLPRFLVDADKRGDRFTSVALRVGASAPLLLAADRPEEARREIQAAMATWSQSRFLLQHWRAMCWEVEIELYLGNPSGACARLQQDAQAVGKSLLLKVQYVRGVTYFLRARTAVAALGVPSSRTTARLAEAKRMIRRLERERMPWTSALTAMADSMLANACGADPVKRILLLRTAIERAEKADLGAHASAARHRLGTLMGGEEGRALVARADSELVAQGVRAPARFVSMLLPAGCP